MKEPLLINHVSIKLFTKTNGMNLDKNCGTIYPFFSLMHVILRQSLQSNNSGNCH